MTTVATWNVNSIKARLPIFLDWLGETSHDIVLLQEIKTVEEGVPAFEFKSLGYNVAAAGQKTYNGVAILSKHPIEVVTTALPGDETDKEARYIEARTAGIRVASIYLPNGNPVNSEKFPYKLAWMERLYRRVRELLDTEDAFVLGGDYNVAPDDSDVYDPQAWKDDALCLPQARAALRKIMYLGLTDAFRAMNRESGHYTWWDYRSGAWPRDQGMRIDHLLLSPQAADRLHACEIDRKPRGLEKPSDHTPIWCRLES